MSRWHKHQALHELLTAVDLDELRAGGCAVPGCAHPHAPPPSILSARCHPGAAVFAEYADGELQLTCAATIAPTVACRRPVARITVAAGAPR